MIAIYIFSYNRPDYLKNCLQSICRHAGTFDVTVVDDDSSLRDVDVVTADFEGRVRIIKPSKFGISANSKKHGGLYANMNWAMLDAKDRGFRFALFIQDDQQLVRQIESNDLNRICKYFDKNTKNYELHTCFLKGQYRSLDLKRMRLDATGTAYHRVNGYGGGNDAFSDVGIFDVQRTITKHCKFKSNERENHKIANSHGVKMGFYRYPFMMWLPFPSSYRNKKRLFLHAFLERLGGAGLHAITDMSEKSVERLLGSNSHTLPVAEDYLSCKTAPACEFWGGGRLSNIIARGSWRRLVGTLIGSLHIVWSKLKSLTGKIRR